MEMNRFNFTKIIILQSIDPSDSSLFSVGEALKKSIDSSLSTLIANDYSFKGFTCDITHINGFASWDSFWNELEKSCNTGCKPIIHFVCHGDTRDNMYIWNNTDYQPIAYSQVYEHLRKVNMLTRNNVFVTMCVCHGYSSLIHLFKDETIVPFCGIVATPNEIYSYDARIRYKDFYYKLLTTQNLTEAHNIIQQDAKQVALSLKDKTADIYTEFSDELFMKAFKGAVSSHYTPNKSENTALNSILEDSRSHGMSDEEILELVEEYKRLCLNSMDTIYRNIRDKKFMLDKYPDERSRYTFPDSVKDL